MSEADLRYERKTVLDLVDCQEALQIVKYHPLLFREIFAARRVNSIYFDDAEFSHYQENLAGVSRRRKIRLRWYGPREGFIPSATLEVKEKKSALGLKHRAKVQDITFPSEDFVSKLFDKLEKSSASSEVQEYIKYLRPAVLCSYQRRYFLSADKKYRLTLDWDISSVRLGFDGSLGIERSDSRIIIEIKYDAADESPDLNLFNQLPLRVNKNSKYTNAIESVVFEIPR